MDFGALMPEINSARMYAGPGAGPLVAAAAAWDALAAELSTTASAYQSIVEGLVSGSWHGPTAASMAAAVAPYVSWMSASAAQAEQTANQARAAVAAYETAFAATVPPPVIAANRSLLASLIATNVLGQNTPAIAATEFHYAEMWAQDAAAMYGYAGSSAAASQLSPFTPPPHTTNAAGMATQSAAVAKAAATAGANTQSTLSQLVTATPQALQNLTSPMAAAAAPAQDPVTSFLDFITGPTSPLSYFPVAGVPYLLAFQNVLLPMAGENLSGALAKASPGAASGGLLAGELGAGTHAVGSSGVMPSVSAGLGRAGLVGKLAVPPGWASAAPAIRPAAFVLPTASLEAAPAVMADGSGSLFSQMALSSLAGRAVAGTGGSVARSVGGGAAGSVGGVETATTATIIVIPELDE
ncbi:putative PPE family protein PPE29 [Mycobacterium sp. MFM001]|uniref:PPE family protein n=1 Tax=Mycobacterium sp. MFM001 TaxID=2049453 RepID=UPI000DA4ED71|nr:PPE family protein [Mycobacterium sp. MFM001]GBE67211.1 putative PPE family protein PPE29 [Mycobacterium sp. MFM001]